MSNLTNIPKQSYFSAQLDTPINASQTSDIYLTAVPDYTPSGETVYINIVDSNNPETITCTGWNPATNVLTGVTRGVATYTGESATGSAHGAGTGVVLSDDWNYFAAIQTAVNSKIDLAGGTFTGPVDFSGASTTFRIPNLTTAQITALASPQNGMLVYDTTLGEFQYYDGGSWLPVGTASVPNASETVAGIIELATVAEQGTATSTGSTGARLVPANSNLVKTSSGAGDENKIAVLNASGSYADGFLNAATSGASKTVKSKSDGLLDDSLLALTTAGDTVYSNGTDLTRLAIGTAGQKMAVNSGATAPSWVTSGKIASAVPNTNQVGSGTFATIAIPANTLGTSNFLRISARITWIDNSSSYTATAKINYGGTTVASFALSNTSGNTLTTVWNVELQANAATNAQALFGTIYDSQGATNIQFVTGSSAIDSTAAQNLTFTVTQDSGTSSVTLNNYTIEVVN